MGRAAEPFAHAGEGVRGPQLRFTESVRELIEMMKSGGILCVVSLSGYLMNIRVSENTAAFTGVGITILSALIPIIATEISLRKKFGKE